MVKTTLIIEKNIFAEKGVQVGTKAGIIQNCVLVTAQDKALTPVDKGQLKNSKMWRVEDKEGGFNEGGDVPAPESEKLNVKEPKKKGQIVGYVGTNSDHWYPEFGTRFQIAQPSLRPAGNLVLRGATGAAVMKRYGQKAMEKEFAKRKVKRTVKNG